MEKTRNFKVEPGEYMSLALIDFGNALADLPESELEILRAYCPLLHKALFRLADTLSELQNAQTH